MTPITKAVFPVAGLGSRFLPATKASPKEMMPVADKPACADYFEGPGYICDSAPRAD